MLKLKLALYVKPGCHLCDDALDLLCIINYSDIEIIDISQCAEGIDFQKFIPVLKNQGTQKILYWPFGLLDIEQLMADD